MKTIIAALMFVSTTAFAQMTIQPIMPRIAPTVVKIDQVSNEIRSIQVNSIGEVAVISRKLGSPVVRFALSPSNKADIVNTAKYLGDVELVTEQHEIVCMMMENPYTARTVYFFNQKQNGLREVLSPEGCSYTTSIFPKNEYDAKQVRNLKFQLISLVNQQLGY